MLRIKPWHHCCIPVPDWIKKGKPFFTFNYQIMKKVFLSVFALSAIAVLPQQSSAQTAQSANPATTATAPAATAPAAAAAPAATAQSAAAAAPAANAQAAPQTATAAVADQKQSVDIKALPEGIKKTLAGESYKDWAPVAARTVNTNGKLQYHVDIKKGEQATTLKLDDQGNNVN